MSIQTLLRVPTFKVPIRRRQHATATRKRILVVDDDPDTLAMLHMRLAEEGFDVSTAGNGVEALARVRERMPDLIVTDHFMPRMTGTELCSALRERAKTQHIPVILCSAHSSAGAGGPCDRVVFKPVSLSHISDEIWALLARSE
jgi:CheY-like chemotaxis protein